MESSEEIDITSDFENLTKILEDTSLMEHLETFVKEEVSDAVLGIIDGDSLWRVLPKLIQMAGKLVRS